MRSMPLVVLVLAAATPALGLECEPWPKNGRARLVVRRAHGTLEARLTGRVDLPAEIPDADVRAAVLAGNVGSGVARGDERGLRIRRRRRARRTVIRARIPLGAEPHAAEPLLATAVVAAPGWCVTALFDQGACRQRRSRVRCRSAEPSAPADVPALHALAGTYDGTHAGAGRQSQIVAALVDTMPGTATLVLRRSEYEGTELRVALRPDGRFALAGYCMPSDVITPAAGMLTATADSSSIRLSGHLRCGGDQTDLVLSRPASRSPSEFAGTYELTLEDFFKDHGSRLRLELAIDETGTATSAPSIDRSVQDAAIGDVGAGVGIVGPEGGIWLSAPYRRNDDDWDLLVLFGRLVSGAPSAPAGGHYYIGRQPLISRSGSWTTDHE
jgi:hypothetical protein